VERVLDLGFPDTCMFVIVLYCKYGVPFIVSLGTVMGSLGGCRL